MGRYWYSIGNTIDTDKVISKGSIMKFRPISMMCCVNFLDFFGFLDSFMVFLFQEWMSSISLD